MAAHPTPSISNQQKRMRVVFSVQCSVFGVQRRMLNNFHWPPKREATDDPAAPDDLLPMYLICVDRDVQ